MYKLLCDIKSPVKFKDKDVSLIPPVVYDKKIYILHDKKLYFVLAKLNKLSEYLKFVRQEGYKRTNKWLSSNGLIGHEFLENISRYWLNNENFNNNYKYEKFYKDKNCTPVIPEHFWNKYFKSVLLYDIISSRKDEFEEFASAYLNLVSIELQSLEQKDRLEVRKEFYKNNIYNYLINNFIVTKNIKISSLFRDVNFSISSEISHNNLQLYKIGGIKGYSGYKFIMNDVKYCECIKNNTLLNFSLTNNLYDFKLFMNSSKQFVDAKIELEKNYMLNVLQNCFKLHPENKTNLSKIYMEKSFEPIEGSNLVFMEENEYDRVITLLNLEPDTIKFLNKLLYPKKNDIYSLIVKMVNDKSRLSLVSSGYANVAPFENS